MQGKGKERPEVLGKAQAPKQPRREGREGHWQGKGRPPGFSTLGSSKKKEIQYSHCRKYYSSLLLHVAGPKTPPQPPQLWSWTEIQKGPVSSLPVIFWGQRPRHV